MRRPCSVVIDPAGSDHHTECASIRASKEHLSFGAGTHRCIGQPLALQQAEIALSSLFQRFPNLALAVPPDEVGQQGTFVMNGLDTLPALLKGEQ